MKALRVVAFSAGGCWTVLGAIAIVLDITDSEVGAGRWTGAGVFLGLGLALLITSIIGPRRRG